MVKVFVDTAAWIALINANDQLHQQAQTVMTKLRRQKARLVTTEFVLLEVADALSDPGVRSHTVEFIDGLRQVPLLQILSVKQDLLVEGWELYSQRPDKDWGLTDCTSFVVMNRKKIMQAFTSDHDFEQAGFINLMNV
jgi:uncharacterized protein